MQKFIRDLFSIKPSPVELCFTNEFKIDPRIAPKQLLNSLKESKQLNLFIQSVNSHQQNGFKILRKLSIVHLCLIYNGNLCESFQQLNFNRFSSDVWMNEHILKPYQQFLQKVACAQEQYRSIIPEGVLQISFQRLFFSISLLTSLFSAVKKISTFARYYASNTSSQFHPSLLVDYVCLCACHAQGIYSSFKVILGEFIRYPNKYIQNEQQKQLLSFTLRDELIKLNQDMKSLFLDKYFFPYGKGYGVKLLRIEELPEDTRDYAQQIMIESPIKPQKRQKRQKKTTLDSILFDRSGRLNPEVVTSLVQIKLNDQSMRRSYRSFFQQSRDYSQHVEDI